MSDNTTSNSNTPGVLSKQAIYNKLAANTDKAIQRLVELLDSPNENIRLGAINKILDKTVADVKAVEITGADGGPLQLRYIIDLAGGYIPPVGSFNVPSGGSNTRSTQIQGTGLAQTSQENNDSSNGTSETGSV